MATALIQFTQGANTDAAGKAVLGVQGDFSTVTVTNGDNTGIVGWKIFVLDAPPDSGAFPPGTLPVVLAEAADGAPTAEFDPDVAGTYRVMLEVVSGSLQVDRDIRCFAIPDARGFVRPPYQENPSPLPVPRPSIIADGPRPVKPDEQNYGDNVRGWSGNGSAAQLDEFFRRYDDLPQQVVDSTPFSALATGSPAYLVDLPTIGGPAVFNLPDDPRAGYVTRIVALGPEDAGASLTISPQGGGSIGEEATVPILGGTSVVLLHQGANIWSILSRADPPTAGTAPVTVISYSGTSVDTETFGSLTAAVAKSFPSSFPNGALYIIAPNVNDVPVGPFTLDNVVEYTFKSLTGLSPETSQTSVTFPDLLIQSSVRVEGCALAAVTGAGANLTVIDSVVGGDVEVGLLAGRDSRFDSTSITVQACKLEGCRLAGATITNEAAVDALVELYGCTFTAPPTVEFDPGPGILKLDAASHYSWEQQGGTLTNGTISLVGAPLYFNEGEPSLTTIVGDMPPEDAYWRVEGATPPVLGFDVGPSTFVGIHGWVSETQLNLYVNGTQRIFASFPDADSAYWAFQLNETNSSFGASVGAAGGPNTYFLATPQALKWEMTAESGSPANVIEARNDDPGGPTLGFFAVPPVLRQSITGATTQDQVDSLVAALAALGLVTDDRV